MKKLGKRAMMDDLFDVLFTVMAAFFIMIFMGIVIGGAEEGKEQAANNQIKILDINNNFLMLLKTPVNEKETLWDLMATVSVKDRHEEFNRVVQEAMEKVYPSKLDRWGVSMYRENETIGGETIGGTDYFGKYKNYYVGRERCKKGSEGYLGKKPTIREILIPQVDGTKVRLVYCIPSDLK